MCSQLICIKFFRASKLVMTKKAATSKLVGFKWCEIHEEWFIKDLMVPTMGTELNNVMNN